MFVGGGMNWREQIEAQIARLKNGDFSDMCEIEDIMQALLDVVVAYDRNNNYVRDYIDGDASDDAWNDLQSAIDKLREVGNAKD